MVLTKESVPNILKNNLTEVNASWNDAAWKKTPIWCIFFCGVDSFGFRYNHIISMFNNSLKTQVVVLIQFGSLRLVVDSDFKILLV